MNNIISANTLFHFTPSPDILLSILTRGFYVRYSLEVFDNLLNDENAELVIPMTCFCDIPLSHMRSHVQSYGKYGIGLTKSWGIKNKVSPVHYALPNSTMADILKSVIGVSRLIFKLQLSFPHDAQQKDSLNRNVGQTSMGIT